MGDVENFDRMALADSYLRDTKVRIVAGNIAKLAREKLNTGHVVMAHTLVNNNIAKQTFLALLEGVDV